jgi:CRP/FNR family transcriptional regulator
MHLERLERAKVERLYARGDFVFREGDAADAIFCLQRGAVKVYKLGQAGEEVAIRLLGSGALMGYRPMLAQDSFAASAVALDDSTICTIPSSLALSILRESPDLALQLLGKLATELRVSEEQMVQRAVESVQQRTARFLLWLYESAAADDSGTTFVSILRREDMATAIGTTPETLSRTLHDLERRRIIELDRRSIRVRRIDTLRRMALDGTVD